MTLLIAIFVISYDHISFRIKLLMQTQVVNDVINAPFKGPVDCAVRIYKQQGILSFWKGNLANVYKHFPNHAISFATKDALRNVLVGKRDHTKEVC
jgi:solute carrier family 25 (adenine nucleotide translocator) protein 4/5/6/31